VYHAAALLLGRQVYVLLIGKKVQVGMSVTVSAKVKKELWKKAKEYGINISEVIREALERRVKEEETKWAIRVMEELSSKAVLEEESSKIIRRERDRK